MPPTAFGCECLSLRQLLNPAATPLYKWSSASNLRFVRLAGLISGLLGEAGGTDQTTLPWTQVLLWVRATAHNIIAVD